MFFDRLFQNKQEKPANAAAINQSSVTGKNISTGNTLCSQDVVSKLESTYDVLASYSETEIVGPIARSAMAEVKLAMRKYPVMLEIIEERFPAGSLTYDKFAGAVEAAMAGIAENSYKLANKMSLFDVEEYRNLRYLIASGAYKDDNVPDDIQLARHELLLANKEGMSEIVTANEKLLLELERFALELGKATPGTLDADTDGMVSEIRKLTEDLRFYSE